MYLSGHKQILLVSGIFMLAWMQPVMAQSQTTSSSTDVRRTDLTAPTKKCYGQITMQNVVYQGGEILCGKTGNQDFNLQSLCNAGDVMVGLHSWASGGSDQEPCAVLCGRLNELPQSTCQFR
jgi:hypothetical protein